MTTSKIALPALEGGKMLRGSFSASNDGLHRFDPSLQGYSHIFLLRTPAFMDSNIKSIKNAKTDNSALAIRHGKNLKALVNYGSIGYSGTPDMTLNTTDINIGNPTGGFAVPTFSQFEGNQFTLKLSEYRGEPLRHLLEFWISAIGDPRSPWSHMHDLSKDGVTPLEPKLETITAEVLIVQTDSTYRYIQNYDIWQAVFPTSVPRSDLDWDSQSIEVMQPKDIQFKGIYVPQPADLFEDVKKLMDARRSKFKAYYNIESKNFVGYDDNENLTPATAEAAN